MIKNAVRSTIEFVSALFQTPGVTNAEYTEALAGLGEVTA